MKNNTKSMIFASILMSFIAVTPYIVKAEVQNGGDDAPVQAAVIVNTNVSNGGDDVAASGTGSETINGNDDVTPVVLNGGDDNVFEGNTSGGTENGNDDVSGNTSHLSNGDDDVAGTGPIPTTPVNPPSNSGNGSGPVGSSGSSVGTSGGRATTLPTLGSFGQCEYITAYMKLGGNNSVAEVTKLQSFLSSQGIAVAATGIFDVETETAVKAFQAKYLDEVMLPWGVTTPSGQVYFTTKKKINEVYCKANFALTAEQIAQIEAYKNAVANGTLNASSTDAETVTGTSSIPLNPEVGSSDNSNQTGAVANTSFFGKVWKFIKGIFGR